MSPDTLPVGTHVISRTQWGARAPREKLAAQGPPSEAFIHYSDTADAVDLVTGPQQATAVRQIQRFHMDGRGWSDIAYHYLVAQPTAGPRAAYQASQDKMTTPTSKSSRSTQGSTFAGRSVGAVPAAQLGHNTGTLAICVLADGDDDIRTHTLYLIETILRRYPSVKTLGGHRDVTATDCPGDRMYAQIARMARATGLAIYPRH